MENNFFIVLDYILHISCFTVSQFLIFVYAVLTYQIVLYLLHSTLVLSFYIDVVWTLSNSTRRNI